MRYHQHVGEYPPLMYSYEQPLINDKFVMGYNGNRVKVRPWQGGAWQVTKEGDTYFKYNQNEYTVNLPVRRAVKTQDVWVWAQGDNQLSTFPVAEMKHVQLGNRGEFVRPAPDAPLVLPRIIAHMRLASEAARLAHLREGVMRKINRSRKSISKDDRTTLLPWILLRFGYWTTKHEIGPFRHSVRASTKRAVLPLKRY